MGYIKHHAIVITGWDEQDLQKLRNACKAAINIAFNANEADSMLTDIVSAKTNGYCSFVVCTDGSKEGWETSNQGDIARNKIIDLIESKKFGYISYAELFYGEDNGESKVTRHN